MSDKLGIKFKQNEYKDELILSEKDPIGFLIPYKNKLRVICMDCYKQTATEYISETLTPLFKINIGQYKQSCHSCNVTMIKSKYNWPELFD